MKLYALCHALSQKGAYQKNGDSAPTVTDVELKKELIRSTNQELFSPQMADSQTASDSADLHMMSKSNKKQTQLAQQKYANRRQEDNRCAFTQL